MLRLWGSVGGFSLEVDSWESSTVWVVKLHVVQDVKSPHTKTIFHSL